MSTWSNSEYVCVNAENLADYYNLLVYKHFNANFVALNLSVLGKTEVSHSYVIQPEFRKCWDIF